MVDGEEYINIRPHPALDMGFVFTLCSSGQVFACANGDEDDDFHLDIAAGVDVALIAAAWVAMDKTAQTGIGTGIDCVRDCADQITQMQLNRTPQGYAAPADGLDIAVGLLECLL